MDTENKTGLRWSHYLLCLRAKFVHSNWIIVCHYVPATLSITAPSSALWLSLSQIYFPRIKTFVCMIMLAFPSLGTTLWMTIRLSGVSVWWGGDTCCFASDFLLLASALDGNLFKCWFRAIIQNESRLGLSSHFKFVVTIYGKVAEEVSAVRTAAGPWEGSTIRVIAPALGCSAETGSSLKGKRRSCR